MELFDCAFPTLADVVCTDNASVGFKDTNYILLVGAKPRGPGRPYIWFLESSFLTNLGMERGDLLKDNGKIFVSTGKAINDNAARNVKVLTVGNPANTNCMIAAHYAKDLPKENFTAMTRLDHDRALYQLAAKTGTQLHDIQNFAIWGNHSPTMYPDITHTLVKGKAETFFLTFTTFVL